MIYWISLLIRNNHNKYNDYVEYETYSIEDVYNELECKDITNRVKDIYKESLV